MSRRVKGKIIDFLTTAGTVTFLAGLLIGPSPDDALDKWMMIAGMGMLIAAFAFCGKSPARRHIER